LLTEESPIHDAFDGACVSTDFTCERCNSIVRPPWGPSLLPVQYSWCLRMYGEVRESVCVWWCIQWATKCE
jgi:hypothetical protein